MSDRFRIVIEGDEATNFSAYSPDLPGVAATGLPERNAKHKCGRRSPPALRAPATTVMGCRRRPAPRRTSNPEPRLVGAEVHFEGKVWTQLGGLHVGDIQHVSSQSGWLL